MNELLKQLENDMKLRGLSIHSIREYCNKVEFFLTWCDKPAHELNEADILLLSTYQLMTEN